MSDITKCPGTNCPHKEKCYRFTAESSEFQSYFTETPIKDLKCDYYWGPNAELIWSELKQIIKYFNKE